MHTFVSLLHLFFSMLFFCFACFVFVMMDRVAARHDIALQRKCTANCIENCATAKYCTKIQVVAVDAMKISLIQQYGITIDMQGCHVRPREFAADFH